MPSAPDWVVKVCPVARCVTVTFAAWTSRSNWSRMRPLSVAVLGRVAFGDAARRLLCREIERRPRVEENEREQRHYECLERARLPGYRQTSPLNGDGAHLSTMKVWYHSVESAEQEDRLARTLERQLVWVSLGRNFPRGVARHKLAERSSRTISCRQDNHGGHGVARRKSHEGHEVPTSESA